MRNEVVDRLEKAAGTPIGGYKDSVKPFHQALLDETGVNTHPHFVTLLRMGATDGRRTLVKVDQGTADITDPSKKDKLYRRIATEGVSLRSYAVEPGFTHRFSVNHFVEEIASNLRLGAKDVRLFLRAMRADLTFGFEDKSSELNDLFIKTANEYFWANTEVIKPSKRYPELVRINEQWDRRSPVTFYQIMYSGSRMTSRIGGWVPYELEAMQKFYEGRTIRGASTPTLFDSRVFQSSDNQDHLTLAEDVRSETGVLIDEEVVLKHRNALIYGRPNTGLFT